MLGQARLNILQLIFWQFFEQNIFPGKACVDVKICQMEIYVLYVHLHIVLLSAAP